MATENILVTGFGPFGAHTINASWEAVKLLPPQIQGCNVIVQEIPVSYDSVDKKIHILWRQHNPKLVIHVGVSSFTDKITIESCAYKEGYDRRDCFGCMPTSGNICPTECQEHRIDVGINVLEICNFLNESTALKAMISEHAGRYLCEYIFFTSLSINRKKTLFIHVPPLDKPYNAQQLANALIEIIQCALNQCNS